MPLEEAASLTRRLFCFPPNLGRIHWRLPLVVFAVASITRLGALAVANPWSAVYSDMANYDQVAIRLQHGMRTAGDTFFPVGYPAFLAVQYTIAGRNFVFVAIIQALFGALTCVLVYDLALRIGRSHVLGLIAGGIAALYPPFVLYGSLLLTEAIAPFWCALTVWLLFRAQDASGRFKVLALSALTGIAFSISVVIRPNLLLLYPVIAVYQLMAAQRSNGPWWVRPVMTAGFAVPLVMIVSGDNSRLLGRPTGLSTNGGMNFFLMQVDVYRLNTPDASWSPPRNGLRYTQALRTNVLSTDESFYYREGVNAFLNRPDKARHTIQNVLEGFGLGLQGYWPANSYFTDDGFKHPAVHRFLRLCSWAFVWLLIVPVWVYTVATWRQMDRPTAARWMLACSLTAILIVTFALFLADPRMHIPFDPILIAFSTIALVRLPAMLVELWPSPLRDRKSAL